ncbi:DUF4247 domain-containing protein [Litchfieldia alkalitelluris]|uniref:DUF4247 domain-containing protein n=1 Tax=Litchfieldia alkalitelluris TaxID=304268 RepID=UPI000997D29D|nr:DUF4247 domain-containing protein [Litchfieldia alkalitelluris]
MKKLLLAFGLLLTFLLVACSNGLSREGVADYIYNEYTLYDTVNDATDTANFSEIYLAENQTIENVSDNIVSFEQPNEISEVKDGKQVLIYDELFVIITEDKDNSLNSNIEVANHDFVRNNYSPSFFNGLFLLWVLDDVLDVDDWGKKRQVQCKQNPDYCYGGYGSSGGYKGINKTPTVRGGSSTVRGGGPGAGK